ncbi:MAG: TonB-dependent receptor [Balneolales bacterium]
MALLLLTQLLHAQPIIQTIRGNVYDNVTNTPLIGATVIILDSEPLLGASTDIDGNFSIRNVRLGRQTIKVNYVGYEPAVISEVLITSAREEVIEVGLRQSVSEMSEMIFTAYTRKDLPKNSMATASARSFTVEETRRYAGGMDDPARLVSAYAGVTTGNLQDNAIIIRGNSPKGVSWRLEGVEIPTPHHFPNGNVAGGGIVTLFSSQMLANSDFFTSAFPAEYGNATAGVFDMSFRNGNYDKREHTVQLGALGIDLASEGPLVQGSNASYLFNYRYSTFGLMNDVGLIPNDQELRYQDLSFKLNIPTKRAGVFSLWGIGGIDKALQPEQPDSTKWKTDWDSASFDWNVQMGGIGLSHRFITGNQTYIKTTLAATGIQNRMESLMLDSNMMTRPDMFASDNSDKISLGSYISHRFSSRHANKSGFTYKHLGYNLDISATHDNIPESYKNVVDERGSSQAVEFYTQSKYNLTANIALNAGVNASYFGVNKAYSIDPRLGLNWDINQDHAVSLAYGRHSQAEELKIYFVKDESGDTPLYPNKDLRLSAAHHFVLGYDWNFSNNHRLKVETYFQQINDAPGVKGEAYSLINFKQEWAFSHILENNSMGRNRGIDVTVERFLNNNYYYLVTGSVFNSRYKGDDGIWRNTRFNKGFVANALIGREFNMDDNNKVLGVNTRLTFVGGERISPLLVNETTRERREIYDDSRAFEEQFPAIFTMDFTVTYRINRRSYSNVWALQVKNMLGAPMYQGEYYNIQSNDIEMGRDVVVIPTLSYKVEF